MERTEKVSVDLLETVVTNPVFLAGIEKSIETTQRTGYEVAFDWNKRLYSGKTFQPDKIILGDERSVGEGVALNRLKQDYEATTGNKYERRSRDWVMFLAGKMEAGLGFNVDYPIPRSKTFDEMMKHDGEKRKGEYTLIHVHTHPVNAIILPSWPDFLHSIYVQREDSHRLGVPTQTIGLVVGTGKGNKSRQYPLMFFKAEEGLNKDEYDSMYLLAQTFGRVANTSLCPLVDARYDSQLKRITFPYVVEGREIDRSPREALANLTI